MRPIAMMVLLSLAPTSLAQEDAREGQSVTYREVTEVDFLEGIEVEGKLITPPVGFVPMFPPPKVAAWTPVRDDFDAEMAREARQQR